MEGTEQNDQPPVTIVLSLYMLPREGSRVRLAICCAREKSLLFRGIILFALTRPDPNVAPTALSQRVCGLRWTDFYVPYHNMPHIRHFHATLFPHFKTQFQGHVWLFLLALIGLTAMFLACWWQFQPKRSRWRETKRGCKVLAVNIPKRHTLTILLLTIPNRFVGFRV